MASSGQSSHPNTPLRPTLYNFSTPVHVSWNTPGTGVSSYYSVPLNTPTPRETPVPSGSVKRKYPGKENVAPRSDAKKRGKKQPLTISDKVTLFHGFLKNELHWSYSEALFYTSQATSNIDFNSTSLGNNDPRVQKWPASRESITATLQHFFNEHTEYPPAKILETWYTHPYGRLERESPDMYSTHTPYTNLKHVRVAISSFAVQTVIKKLVGEVEVAIAPSSGLHLSLSRKSHTTKAIEWKDIGGLTFENAEGVIRKHQPVLWNVVNAIVVRRSSKKIQRDKRPPNLVAVNVISTMNYSRSSRAKLLPLATALMYFGSKAPFDLFRYRSRIGDMPSYNTVIRSMDALSECEAALTLSHGLDQETIGIIRLDNVQNYLFQRDTAIGRENKLNIGLAATYYEIELDGVDLAAFSLDNIRKTRLEHPRDSLTIHGLHKLLDDVHLEEVCILQWISTLVHYIPLLSSLEPEISVRYRTKVAKQPLENKPSKIHPLASSSRNETITTDLKAALLDFLEQTGHTTDIFKKQLFPIGGDGLTYEKMVQLKEFLQFHENDLQSMRIVQPLLEWWHTEWTNLCRIFESHWGEPLTNDPSRLAHSAAKIGHKKPSNLKKVDFYNGREFVFLVLDARILDCWRLFYQTDDLFRHFDSLASTKRLPSYEDLEIAARRLYRSYTSVRSQERVMRGQKFLAADTAIPICQEAWVPLIPSTDSHGLKFGGDQVLARSISFMREAMMARELSLATAEGDVGRVWEIIKTMAFTFAGSSHSKYMGYVLEMIATLEVESTEELRRGLLQMTLVNLTGRAGNWCAGDFIQEYFNRLLEAVVQRKGVDYGNKFIRKTWSRNLHHVARLKLSWFDGLGLEARSAKHSKVALSAELRILANVYKAEKLHHFQARRTYDTDTYLDDFQRGAAALANGKLQKWIYKATHSRDLQDQHLRASAHSTETNVDELVSEIEPTEDHTGIEDMPIADCTSGLDSDSDSDSDEFPIGIITSRQQNSLRFSGVVGGRLIVREISDQDVRENVDEILAKDDSDSESEESDCDVGDGNSGASDSD